MFSWIGVWSLVMVFVSMANLFALGGLFMTIVYGPRKPNYCEKLNEKDNVKSLTRAYSEKDEGSMEPVPGSVLALPLEDSYGAQNVWRTAFPMKNDSPSIY